MKTILHFVEKRASLSLKIFESIDTKATVGSHKNLCVIYDAAETGHALTLQHQNHSMLSYVVN